MASVPPKDEPSTAEDELQTQLERLVIKSIQILTKLRAEVSEMQVHYVQREQTMGVMRISRLIEEARNILEEDVSDTLERLEGQLEMEDTTE